MSFGYKYILDEKQFKGDILDKHLANGYYRMQESMFTTDYLLDFSTFNISPVFWLRTNVKNIVESNTAKTIRKVCKSFTTTYKKAIINEEINGLYNLYKDSISHSISPTCFDYLYDNNYENPFDSLMVEIRDGDLLIAVGYFDKGLNSIAGILNFYHPLYKKYSLGKYLILSKIDFAKQNDVEFYYTGYLTTNTTKFDYKIFPDKNAIEVFLSVDKKWRLYNNFTKETLYYYFQNNLISANTNNEYSDDLDLDISDLLESNI